MKSKCETPVLENPFDQVADKYNLIMLPITYQFNLNRSISNICVFCTKEDYMTASNLLNLNQKKIISNLEATLFSQDEKIPLDIFKVSTSSPFNPTMAKLKLMKFDEATSMEKQIILLTYYPTHCK